MSGSRFTNDSGTTQRPRVVVVLGMHRSGTSALTKALEIFDVDLGTQLMPPDESANPKGFFEDLGVVEINEEILRSLGRGWSTLAPLDEDSFVGPQWMRFQRAAEELLVERLSHFQIFGLKDPRLCLTWPLWKRALAAVQAEFEVIVAVRDPLSVAYSLRRRDGFDLQRSLAIWFLHTYQSLYYGVSQQALVVDFNVLVDDPAEVLRSLSHHLRTPFDEESPKARNYLSDFLDATLRHSEPSLHTGLDRALVAGLIGDLYGVTKQLTARRCEAASEVESSLYPFGEYLRNAKAILEYLDQTLEDLRVANELAPLVPGLRAALDAEHVNNVVLTNTLNGVRQSLEESLAEREQSAAEILTLQRRVEELGALVIAERNQISELRATMSWRITAPLRTITYAWSKMLRHE